MSAVIGSDFAVSIKQIPRGGATARYASETSLVSDASC